MIRWWAGRSQGRGRRWWTLPGGALAAPRMGLILTMSLALATAVLPAYAQGGEGGMVYTDPTGHFLLAEGEQIDGDLVVWAQTITLQHGSMVTGTAALVGEAITLNGQVMGDLAVMGDNVLLGSGASVSGSATLCGRSAVRREQSALVMGDYRASCDQVGINWEDVDPASLDFDWLSDLLDGVSARVSEGTPLERLGQNVLRSLVMGALAAFFTLVGPLRLRRMSDAALIAPFTMGFVGLLTLVVAAAVTVLLVVSVAVTGVTICLMPFAGLAWLLLLLMVLMGWSAICLPVGAGLLAQMNIRRVSPLAAAAVGAVAFTFLTGLLTLIPETTIVFIGLALLLASLGLGTVIMTRLGAQSFHRRQSPMHSVSRRA